MYPLFLRPYLLDHRLKDTLIMFDSPEQKAEKARALKKLMYKWLSVQATESKATLLISRNPDLMPVKKKKSPKNST